MKLSVQWKPSSIESKLDVGWQPIVSLNLECLPTDKSLPKTTVSRQLTLTLSSPLLTRILRPRGPLLSDTKEPRDLQRDIPR